LGEPLGRDREELLTYYPDEIAFGDGELVGLTEAEAESGSV
jgi:hypothetical protein